MFKDYFIRGTQVIYIPTHANRDLNHPDCEEGFVTAHASEEAVFVRYFRRGTDELRTLANSEATDISDLVILQLRPQEQIQDLLFSLGYGVDMRPGYTCNDCGVWIGPPGDSKFCEVCQERRGSGKVCDMW